MSEVVAQEQFDLMIGRLDRILSEMISSCRSAPQSNDPNHQTLKHHAQDMIGAGEKCLGLLQSFVECNRKEDKDVNRSSEPIDVPYPPSGDPDPYEADPSSAPELPDNIR